MLEVKSHLLYEKPSVALPLNLSVSKVKTFKDCKAKFRYSYIEKLPKKDWEFLAFGKFLHEILENFHKFILDGNTDPANILMGRCFKISYENWKDKMTPPQLQESKDILTGYLKKLTDLGDLAPTILTVEKPFYIDIDGKILLNGFIDRTQRDHDGVLHVSDYKTTKNKKYLKNDYFQLLTYAFLLFLEDPSLQLIRTSYILLRHNFDTIEREFTREEAMKIEGTFLEWADKIHSEKLYRPSPSPLCSYCDYLERCPEGQRIAGNNMIAPKFGVANW